MFKPASITYKYLKKNSQIFHHLDNICQLWKRNLLSSIKNLFRINWLHSWVLWHSKCNYAITFKDCSMINKSTM